MYGGQPSQVLKASSAFAQGFLMIAIKLQIERLER
jgi:hypothetical protein